MRINTFLLGLCLLFLANVSRAQSYETTQPLNSEAKLIIRAETQNVLLWGGMGGYINYKVLEVIKGEYSGEYFSVNFMDYDDKIFYYKEALIEFQEVNPKEGSGSLQFATINESYKNKITAPNYKHSDFPDFTETDPIGFLEYLKNKNLSCMIIPRFQQFPKNWIQEKHIPALMSLIDSKEVVIPVYESYNVSNAFAYSTLGREALYLIEGFRKKEYPPSGSSIPYQADKDHIYLPNPEKIKEMRKWWQDYTKISKD